MRRLGNFAPNLGNRTSYKKVAELGNSLALDYNVEWNSISPHPSRGLYGCIQAGLSKACLTTFNFEVYKREIFKNPFLKSSRGQEFTFCGQIWWKSAVAKLPQNVISFCGRADSTILPHLADRVQNFRNFVTPWPVHVYQMWSGSVAVCQSYSGKIDFSEPKVSAVV